MALSDLEVGVGKAGGGKITDFKSQKPAPVGLNPWKLARVRTEDAASAAARARQNSSILLPHRPALELALSTDSDCSSFQTSLSSSGEIRAAPSSRRKKYRRPGLRRELWSLSKNKRDRITPLSDGEMFVPREGLHPLSQEPRSPYRSRSSSFSGDPRASYPPEVSYPQRSFPPQVLFPRYPGDERSFYPVSSGAPSQADSPNMDHMQQLIIRESVNSVDASRASTNSDGYEASCGSGDDTSEAGAGHSQSWNKASWSKFSMSNAAYSTPAAQIPVWGTDYKEENVKPWVTFTAGNPKQDVKESPGCKCT